MKKRYIRRIRPKWLRKKREERRRMTSRRNLKIFRVPSSESWTSCSIRVLPKSPKATSFKTPKIFSSIMRDIAIRQRNGSIALSTRSFSSLSAIKITIPRSKIQFIQKNRWFGMWWRLPLWGVSQKRVSPEQNIILWFGKHQAIYHCSRYRKFTH